MRRFLGFSHRENQPRENGIIDCSDNSCTGEINGLSDLYCPQEDSAAHIRDVADVLLEMGEITAEQLSEVKCIQAEKPGRDITQKIKELQFRIGEI